MKRVLILMSVSLLASAAFFTAKAEVTVKERTMLSDDSEYALELALKYRENGFPEKAKEVLEKAEAAFKRCVELDPKNAYAWRNLGYLEWKFTHPTDEKLGWERFKDAFTCYRKAIELKPDNPQYLLEFDELAEEVGISVSERYRMLRSHHDAVARLPAALERECRTATVEGDYDYALGLGLDENLPCVVNARILRDRECGKRPELKTVPSECEIPYRWARGEDLAELLASAKAEPGTYKAFWLSGLRALQSGKPLEARENFIRASNSKRVLGKKLAYDAVANCVTVFGPDTQLVAKQQEFTGDPRVQLWHFEKKSMPIVAFWFGTERPTPTTKVEEVALDVSQFGFKDPVWVDLGSGAVYAFPKEAKKVPMCDSPCLLAERTVIDG